MNKSAFFLACLALILFGPANAHEYKLGSITIGHPSARPTAPGVPGAAYLSLENTGQADKLISATSPLAGKTQIHRTIDEGGVMKMREAADGVELAPHSTVLFKPGGHHIMLIDLKHALSEGEHIPLTLTFEKAGSIDVEVYVEKPTGGEHDAGATHGHDMPHHAH
jgi:periplasmic copper chaperone A